MRRGEHRLRFVEIELPDGSMLAVSQIRAFHEKDQLMGLDRKRRHGGYIGGAQIEDFTGGGVAEG